MSAIQDIFVRFAPAYLARFGALMPKAHQRVINAIIACRTGALGSVCFACGTSKRQTTRLKLHAESVHQNIFSIELECYCTQAARACPTNVSDRGCARSNLIR